MGGGADKSPLLQFEMPDKLPPAKGGSFFIPLSLDLYYLPECVVDRVIG